MPRLRLRGWGREETRKAEKQLFGLLVRTMGRRGGREEGEQKIVCVHAYHVEEYI
jgi:hypothetical protein